MVLWVVLWLCSRYPKFGRTIIIGSKRLLLYVRKFLSIWLRYKPLKIRIYMCSVEHRQGLIRSFWALYQHWSCSSTKGFGTCQIQRKCCQTPLGFLCSLCTAKYSERAFRLSSQTSPWLRRWTCGSLIITIKELGRCTLLLPYFIDIVKTRWSYPWQRQEKEQDSGMPGLLQAIPLPFSTKMLDLCPCLCWL